VRQCETRKGQYDNCTKNYFNYLRDWINQRSASGEAPPVQ
jgi:hypothetical protein